MQRWLTLISATMTLEQPGQSISRIMRQCTALAHLDLQNNDFEEKEAESLAGVLVQCPALAHLDLSNNQIGPDGA